MTTKHVNLRLTPEMHRRLVAAAERNHRSLNGQIEEYCENGLIADEARGKEVHHRDGDPRNNDPSDLELREPTALTGMLSRLGRGTAGHAAQMAKVYEYLRKVGTAYADQITAATGVPSETLQLAAARMELSNLYGQYGFPEQTSFDSPDDED